MTDSIKSEKITVNKIFSDMWLRIPVYQRPYVWEEDQVMELLEDTYDALQNRPENEYFMGSFVFQPSEVTKDDIKFTRNDLLDGQQRITTLFILFAVLRDMTKNSQTEKTCQGLLFQEENALKCVPEIPRISFETKDGAGEFISGIARTTSSTGNIGKGETLSNKASRDVSVKNMLKAIGNIRQFFKDFTDTEINQYIAFVLNRVVLIYVSAQNREDAFRLFTVLNDRGIPLGNRDILKSINLGALVSEDEKKRYAKIWEEIENWLGGESFERFLGYVRTILVKEKARMSLAQEYEKKIYLRKRSASPLLEMGKNTFELINRYFENYQALISDDNKNIANNLRFSNLIGIMLKGLPSRDWLPPLLRYYDKFKENGLLDFLEGLDNKFSADWVNGLTPTKRILGMNEVIKKIDEASNFEILLSSKELNFDKNTLLQELEGNIYGRQFDKYILLKLDYVFSEEDQGMDHGKKISIEHILPQNPKEDSQWKKDFTDGELEELTHKLGNLALISRRKNSELGRLDFIEKKQKYFENNIGISQNSMKVLGMNNVWTPTELNSNQDRCVEKLKTHYSINGG